MIAPRGLVVGAVVVAGLGVGARSMLSYGQTATLEVHEAGSQRPYVKGEGTNLRSCPIGYDWHSGNDWKLDCRVLEQLAPGTHVTMLCWVSTTPPWEGASAKWFKVGRIEGRADDLVGWVWSDNIDAQTPGTPECDHIGHEKDPEPKAVQPPAPAIVVSGHCTSAGGMLYAATKNYVGDEVSLPYIGDPGIWKAGAHVRSIPGSLELHRDGSLTWSWSCAGLAPGRYEIGLQLASNAPTFAEFHVAWPPPPSEPQQPPPVVESPKPATPPATKPPAPKPRSSPKPKPTPSPKPPPSPKPTPSPTQAPPPPPPPPPTVTVSWGARAPSSYCGGDTSCTYVTISWSNFSSGDHTITPYFDGQGDWCPSSCDDSKVRSGSSGSFTGYWAAGYCRQSHTVSATVDGVWSNNIDTIDHGC